MTDTPPSGTEPPALVLRTKLRPPRLRADLVPRPRLLTRLRRGLDRKVTLVSALAGAGKTTLLAQWLQECGCPSAWLALDEYDNDLSVFVGCLVGAIRSACPDACEGTLGLLNGPELPPLRPLTTSLASDLDELTGGLAVPPVDGPSAPSLVLVLDDYHLITEPAVHEFMSGLIAYLPRGIHLAVASRTDPPLHILNLRARGELNEVRSADLRFTPQESDAFLQAALGRALDGSTAALLEERIEGWAVGLRLAALSMRSLPDEEAIAERLRGVSGGPMMDYLVGEVLSQQPPETQDVLLRISILDRFCAPLCEAVCDGQMARDTRLPTPCRAILQESNAANLFIVPLDAEGTWHRYHHLFRELLQHRLRERYRESDISALHARAGAWYAGNGLIEEAMHHLMAAGDTTGAVDLMAQRRYALLNHAQWQRLDQYLHQFPADVVDQYPELLILRTWLAYHRGQYAPLPSAVARLEEALAHTTLPPETVNVLQGEISALRSLLSYFAVDPQSTIAHAQSALERVPGGLWIVRVMARLYLAGALMLSGDLEGAYAAIYDGFREQEAHGNAFRATTLMTACHIHWMAADLDGMARAAGRCIALGQDAASPEILGYGRYHLGRVLYQRNDLDAAEAHFSAVTERPYLNYGTCYIYDACGLALTYQAQDRPLRAREVAEAALEHTLETGNTTLLPAARAFQAELALLQARISAAVQWAAQFDAVPPLSPPYGLFAPHLTLVKVWLAQGTAHSLGRARELLGQVRAFLESTHNTRFTIEALALQALLHSAEGDTPAALTALEDAIALTEAGGFIRLFVDLGTPIAGLLGQLHRRGVAPDYVARILAAFPSEAKGPDAGRTTESRAPSSVVRRPSSTLIEPLTNRELEVLALLARRLTNKEIAQRLTVSPSTVKTHTLNVYRKLDVRGRRQAVARARELGLLLPSVE